MKYYAITKGTYSDYHIITITADKEKAELLAEWHTDDYDYARVEEFEDSIEVQLPIYIIWLCNGKINGWSARAYDEGDKNKLNNITSLDGYVLVQAKGEEQAKKIVYDLIAEYKAKNSGIV